jgi:4a-hydroxytetrahydrobiopterin dehydratase
MSVLSQNEIMKRISGLKGWYLDKDAIRRDWVLDDFKSALRFINRVGDLAEKHNHHPEIYNVYNKVSLRFNTHSANGITAKDFAIAEDINHLD